MGQAMSDAAQAMAPWGVLVSMIAPAKNHDPREMENHNREGRDGDDEIVVFLRNPFEKRIKKLADLFRQIEHGQEISGSASSVRMTPDMMPGPPTRRR